MKIAQIAPIVESVPPQLYGGTERIVCYLTDELVRQGHQVTLFASGDSATEAELVSCVDRALRLDSAVIDPLPYYAITLDKVRRRQAEFDILHFHIDCLHFPLFHPQRRRTVTTLHGRQDLPDLAPLYRAFDDMPVSSISFDQRHPLPHACWVGNVHHGLPADLYPFTPARRQPYLAFLGRICAEKQPDHAIEIARRCGIPLKIAAKVDKADRAYHDQVIRPLLDQPGIEFLGEIDDAAKAAFLGDALALLFPIDWPEPFGLVVIEAMACGTPVIAYRRGSVPEIVDDGISGFIVDGIEGAVAAVGRVATLDRGGVRRCFERRFSAERMARDYLQIYREMLGQARTRRPGQGSAKEPLRLPRAGNAAGGAAMV